MSIIFLLYVTKRCFSGVNIGKLEESSRTTLPFGHVCLRCHSHFTHETGRVAYLWILGWSFWANCVDNSVNMGEILAQTTKNGFHVNEAIHSMYQVLSLKSALSIAVIVSFSFLRFI